MGLRYLSDSVSRQFTHDKRMVYSARGALARKRARENSGGVVTVAPNTKVVK